MQIFSSTADVNQTSQAGFGQLPFSFGMPIEEGKEFYAILEQTIQDLESGNLNNEEIAEKLEFIEKSIPDELMAQIEQQLNIDLDKFDKTEELSAKAFAVLNLVDNIIDDMNKVENQSQLESSMTSKGVSQSNIETTIQMLDTVSKNTDESIKTTYIEQAKNAILRQDAISQFKASHGVNTQELAEKVLAGKQLQDTPMPVEPTAKAPIEQAEPILNTQSSTQATKEQNPTLTHLLSLFKKTKDQAELAGLNLSAKPKATEASAKEPTSPIAQNIPAELTNNSSQVQAQAVMQNEALFKQETSKTNGAINKSEFKELSSKFIAEQSSDFVAKPTETTAQEFTPITQTATSENNINLTKSFVTTQNITEQINNQNMEAAQAEFTEMRMNAAEEQETKLASNFNSNLYKLAQEANSHMQVNVALKTFKQQNMQQLKIRLNPEELGSVTIAMEMVDGAARGVITAERPEVAQQLAQNLKGIYESFKNSGLQVDIKDIVVKIDDQPSNNKNQQNHNSKEDSSQNFEFTFSEQDLVDIQV